MIDIKIIATGAILYNNMYCENTFETYIDPKNTEQIAVTCKIALEQFIGSQNIPGITNMVYNMLNTTNLCEKYRTLFERGINGRCAVKIMAKRHS